VSHALIEAREGCTTAMPRSLKPLSSKSATTKRTASRAKKAQARSSAVATKLYPRNARFPAKRNEKGEIVLRSRQMRLLEQVGGAAQAEIFFSGMT
jgi:hypothetical protein